MKLVTFCPPAGLKNYNYEIKRRRERKRERERERMPTKYFFTKY
jgi:hypothetical protein